MRLLEAPASPAGARFPDVSGANGGMLLLRALKKMAGVGSRPAFGVFSILLASRPMAFRRAHILILERRMISKKTKGVAGLRKNCSAIARFWQTMLFLPHGCDTGPCGFYPVLVCAAFPLFPPCPSPALPFGLFMSFPVPRIFRKRFSCYFSFLYVIADFFLFLFLPPLFSLFCPLAPLFDSLLPPPCSAARVKVFLAGRRKCRIMSQC